MKTREWKKIEDFDFKEILFEEYNGIAKITINRPRYRNAFTPRTTWEMSQAFAWCREAQRIGVVILTGAGDKAFCSGGDMNVKGRGGYIGDDGVPRLNVLDVQKQIRSLPKPVIRVRRWVRSTPVSEQAIWHASWDRKRRAKYGSSAVSTVPPKPNAWAW